VTFKLSLRATNFIVDAQGAPIGVRFNDEKKGGSVDIKAKKIIVATGGFSCNQEMVSAYLPAQATKGPLTVNSMGEGHQLCKALGGVYNRMDMVANLMSDLAQVTVWGYFGPNVQITPQGRRFIKEDQSHDSPDVATKLGLGFWWSIFDNQLIDGSQKWNVALNMKSNADRLVGPCNTLEELAAAMDVPADTLKTTFETYDAMVAAGEDTEFKKKLFLQSLAAPFYAMKHFPYRYKTHGGLKVTTESQLVDKDNKPIANVYCCGSTVADSGSDLSPNAASGLISGKAVVAALKA
ncbi:MAG: FAD-binding protein, partial [Raoultibacter sp.]